MNSKFKDHMFILFAYVGSILASFVIGNTFLLTICNAIWGSAESGGQGTVATEIIMRLLVPVFAIIAIYIRKRNNRDAYREYTKKMKEQEYSAKKDFQELLRNKNLWAEIIFTSIISVIYWAINFRFFWLLLNIPIFMVFDFLATIRIHYMWLNSD